MKTSKQYRRFVSLDVFRGIAITGMILVNHPGSWQHVYPPLLHAEWHGCTPTDLVFPSFLFIVGVSLSFSLRKYRDSVFPTRILNRTLILFGLGLLLNVSSLIFAWMFQGVDPDFSQLRLMGVLQRISIAYFLASLLILRLSPKNRAIAIAVLLIGYWVAMALGGDFSPENNLAAKIDRWLLSPDRLYLGGPYDPEGLFSTIPTVATVLIGNLTGEWLQQQPITRGTSIKMVLAGLSCLVVGILWDVVFPTNKALWTSSYVIFSAGWALLIFAGCFEAIELRGWRKWSFPFEVMGLNAIFVFVASGIITRILYKTGIGSSEEVISTYTWLYQVRFVG
ncbi:MAG: heparan-alpha-glucosaminide N-acetyltransferase domain-containing protein [Prochloraceae cyanobacterium]|nr:heparan-alpha-glucosaminide N-acetyltransferase domain-containing protein [Prochloraceae cyanobacterium]